MQIVIVVVVAILLLFSSCQPQSNRMMYLAMAQEQTEQEQAPIVHQGDLVFPLVDTYTFTNDYGIYADGSGPHYGVDLHTTIGNQALSVSDGEVIELVDGARDNPIPSIYSNPPYASDSIRGNYITIKSTVNDKVLYFRYMHFKQGSIIVQQGDTITKGQQIAQVGNSGLSWGAHLHFEVRKGLGASSTDTLDPKQYLDFGTLGGTHTPQPKEQTERS